MSEKTKTLLDDLKKSMAASFKESNENTEVFHRSDISDRIWSLGPKKCGTNILVNLTDFNHKKFWDLADVGANITVNNATTRDLRSDLENSFLSGFQLASLAGPLCEEPMHGVCFVVEDWSLEANIESTAGTGQISGRNWL